MNRQTCTLFSEPDYGIKLYSYRWIIITIFGLYSSINYFQFMQFTIIGNIVQKYYAVNAMLVDMTTVVFMAFYILLFIPTGYFAEKWSLKTTSIIGSGLTALGNCLKLFATSPDRFYVILISQSMCAIAQTFMLIIPTKLASTWFGAEEVSTACAMGVFGGQIGLAIGSILPTVIVTDSDDKYVIEEGLSSLFLYNAIASVGVVSIVIVFFRSKPPSAPSKSQTYLISRNDNQQMTYWLAVRGFAKNKDFIIVVSTLGLAFGLWTACGVLVNQMFSYSFPEESNSLVGFLSLASIIAGGFFGTVIFGYLLDKTHKFKSISFYVLLGNLITFILQAVFLLTSDKLGTCIITPINGFFSGGLMVIAYEYVIETTYPTPEAFGAAILNVFIYVSAIIHVVILSLIFDSVHHKLGYIVILFSLVLSTFPILFISPELKRRDANLVAHSRKIMIAL